MQDPIPPSTIDALAPLDADPDTADPLDADPDAPVPLDTDPDAPVPLDADPDAPVPLDADPDVPLAGFDPVEAVEPLPLPDGPTTVASPPPSSPMRRSTAESLQDAVTAERNVRRERIRFVRMPG
jgi:hypothetical protein